LRPHYLVVVGGVLLVAFAAWAQGVPVLEEAMRALRRGELELAIVRSTVALAAPDLTSKDRGAALRVRGLAYGRKGNLPAAVRDLGAAIDANRLDTEAYYSRGVAYTMMRDLDRAILDFSAALRFDPTYADAYYGRGFAYLLANRPERAIEDLDETLRRDPSRAIAWHLRGGAYALLGRPDRAISDFDTALRLKPSDAASLYERGFAYAAKADLERATKDVTTAAALNPTRVPPLPPSVTSEYLVTKGSGISVSKVGEAFVGAYSISLAATSKLTRRAYLVTAFQHPTDRDQPIIVNAEIAPGGSGVLVLAPAVSGFTCGLFSAVVSLYDDEARRNRFGVHVQMIRSTVTLSRVRTLADTLPSLC